MMHAILACVITAAGSRSLYSIVRRQRTANCVHQLVGKRVVPAPAAGSGSSGSGGGAMAADASAEAAYLAPKSRATARRVASFTSSSSSAAASPPAGGAQLTTSRSQSAGLDSARHS
jgi:hypothetical protein